MNHPKQKEILDILNQLYQLEIGGIQRYLHYSFMIMGHNRIPIQKWLRDQATESMGHAVAIGEKITAYGGHPSMLTAAIPESNVHTIDQMLQESLTFETGGVEMYKKLLTIVGEDIALEEFARGFIFQETEHLEEVRKMIKKPE